MTQSTGIRLVGGPGGDRLLGSGNNDVICGLAGDDELRGGKGNDWVYGGTGDDRLFGESGDDRLVGECDNDKLFGGSGRDTLIGGRGNDTLVGGTEYDILDGGAGDDTYIYNHGDGRDYLIDTGSSDGVSGGDTLEFGEGIGIEDLVLRRPDDEEYKENLRVYVGGSDSTDYIIIAKWEVPANRIETFRFNDGNGNMIDYDVSALTIQDDDDIGMPPPGMGVWDEGDAGDNALEGYEDSDFLFGRGGDDKLIGHNGDDHLWGGEGNDNLTGGADSDTLQGGAGDDTYIFKRGHGRDEIIDTASSSSGSDSAGDILEFDGGITLDDLVLQRDGKDLKVHVIPADSSTTPTPLDRFTDVITIRNWETATNRIETFRFRDAEGQVTDYDLSGLTTTFLSDDLPAEETSVPSDRIVVGDDDANWMDGFAVEDKNDTFDGREGADFLLGRGGNDQLKGRSGDDYLSGGKGDDKLFGGDNNDTLLGGIGDDQLNGGLGDDIYIIEDGHGKDEIVDTGSSDGDSGGDTLEFGKGITLDDLVLRRVGENLEDLEIYVINADNPTVPLNQITNVITITDWATAAKRIETFRFTDAEMIVPDYDLSGLATTIHGTGSGNSLKGNDKMNWIDGSAVGETIKGRDGGDFLFGRGGNDEINGNQGEDKIYGGTGEDHIRGGKDNDTIDGGEDKDIIYGDLGDDTYIASAGADVYHFRSGDGQDTYRGASAADRATDVLAFEDGVTRRDLWFRRDGDDLEVSLRKTGDGVTFENWWSGGSGPGGHISGFRTDSRSLSHEQVQTLLNLMQDMEPVSDGDLSQEIASVIDTAWVEIA